MERAQAAERLLQAKRESDVTFETLGEAIGHDPVWTAAVLHGQVSVTEQEARTLCERLDVDPEGVVGPLQRAPRKGDGELEVPTDPMLYRLYEVPQVYGEAIKSVVHEEFGDGIMSAIDFECHVDRVEGEDGEERVRITYEGKFLPYAEW